MARTTVNANTLRRVLQQQLLLSKQLIALAEEQSEVIVAGDIARLSELEMAQHEILEQQEALESSRVLITRELSWSLNQERISGLSSLLEVLPPRDQEPLKQVRTQLLEAQGQLDILQARNLRLLDNALEYVRFSLDILTTAALQPAAYGTNLTTLSAPAFYVDSKA